MLNCAIEVLLHVPLLARSRRGRICRTARGFTRERDQRMKLPARECPQQSADRQLLEAHVPGGILEDDELKKCANLRTNYAFSSTILSM